MIVLGLGFTDHEASAALVIDGVLASAISRERLTRMKKDGKTWGSGRLDLTPCIQYCLGQHDLRLDQVDLTVWNHVDHVSRSVLLAALEKEGAADLSGTRTLVLPHHFAHACCALYLSPFKDAAVFVADGSGGPLDDILEHCEGPEIADLKAGTTFVQNLRSDRSGMAREHETFYHYDGERWHCLRKIVGDWGGIGSEYGSVSEFLFGDPLHSGKTMGLAPYGTACSGPLFLAPSGPPGTRAFKSYHPPRRDALEDEMRLWFVTRQPIDGEHAPRANFAATIQMEFEVALLTHVRWLRDVTRSTNLCLSGGVALNSVANSIVARDAGFSATFVPPAPGDDGISIGGALFGSAFLGVEPSRQASVYLGRNYEQAHAEVTELGFRHLQPDQDLFRTVGAIIANGSVVAWYQGGAEIGPRALGNRSFLADPRRSDMKSHLNLNVKKRESFRPFAPVVPEAYVLEYFEDHFPSDYMSFVSRIRRDKLELLPAVAHIDGTARYQVLKRTDNPRLHDLIEAFGEITGVPVLLNTSLNMNNEPIVETPVEAAYCARRSGAQYLVLNDHLYARQ